MDLSKVQEEFRHSIINSGTHYDRDQLEDISKKFSEAISNQLENFVSQAQAPQGDQKGGKLDYDDIKQRYDCMCRRAEHYFKRYTETKSEFYYERLIGVTEAIKQLQNLFIKD